MHVLLGNHDVEQIREIETKPISSCIVTAKQKYYMDSNSSKYSYKDKMKLIDTTLIIFLNTTLYTTGRSKFIKCTKEILPNNNLTSRRHTMGGSSLPNFSLNKIDRSREITKYLDLEEREYYKQLQQIKHSGALIHNIIITGHDPILGPKYKDGGVKLTPIIAEGIEFIGELYSYFPNAKKYYLCADVHLYQKGIITITRQDKTPISIEQHIVGTGGASLDLCTPKSYII